MTTDERTPIEQALDVLKQAMQDDPHFAWTWHCAAWSCVYDEHVDTDVAHRAAARFMRMAFDVDTQRPPLLVDDVQAEVMT